MVHTYLFVLICVLGLQRAEGEWFIPNPQYAAEQQGTNWLLKAIKDELLKDI